MLRDNTCWALSDLTVCSCPNLYDTTASPREMDAVLPWTLDCGLHRCHGDDTRHVRRIQRRELYTRVQWFERVASRCGLGDGHRQRHVRFCQFRRRHTRGGGDAEPKQGDSSGDVSRLFPISKFCRCSNRF